MKATLLTVNETFEDGKLDIIKEMGTKAKATDFAIATGVWVPNLEDRFAPYYLKDPYEGFARAVSSSGKKDWNIAYRRLGGVRPALKFSSIDEINSNGVRVGENKLKLGVYVDNALLKDDQNDWTNALSSGTLRECGKYTIDSVKYTDYDIPYSPIDVPIYEYNGKRAIRIKVNSSFDGNTFKLSNGESYKDGDYVWFEVKDKIWHLDEKNLMAISEEVILGGIQFNEENNYHNVEDFPNTNIGKYLNDVFLPELMQFQNMTLDNSNLTSNEEKRKTKLQMLNPDTTEVTERRKMTDTEIIHNWIEAGQSVLLRGPSGIGKTERIKTLYPDLIYIKLTNNMFPEKVVGSMNLQTGENIPPDFAKQALMACATDEERKLIKENIQNIYDLADTIYERSKNTSEKIVILLDELLNVKPAVQSLVYTLVLNRLVETGKGLKLPENVVIVATGNQKKYSNVAEDIAEPLEKRFDHILDMMPKVSEWINEYAIPNKVHPSVIGYIFSKYLEKGRSEAISDIPYFYEEPEVGEKETDKYGCRGRTNDPRGWVSISNTLYAFEKDLADGKFIGKNVEDILQRSLTSKLRNVWAFEFYNFYNIPTLSVNEVVNNIYDDSDLPKTSNERFASVTSLLLADESEVAICRKFIDKYCDSEYLKLYDMCWIGKDEKRMEKIAELEELDLFLESENIKEEEVKKL